tara:strand:+ start:359 stop:664 length:306 start_codon:yes stop_codon:yes gene_type:complete
VIQSKALIYRPTKTAMQSGRAKIKHWVLEFEPSEARKAEPLMGWISSGDTKSQIKIMFPSKAEAIEFADREGLTYQVIEPRKRKIKAKSYADNFSYSFRFK